GSNVKGFSTFAEVIVTMSPGGIGFPSQLARTHDLSFPSSPVGAEGIDIEGLPCVGDCGDSSPVVCSTAGLVVDPEIDEPEDEPDAEELESLGCIHAANSSTRTIAAMPNRMTRDGFIVPPIRCVIARSSLGHNLAIRVSYTFSEKRVTSLIRSFQGFQRRRRK